MKVFIWFLFFLPIVFSADEAYDYYQLVQQWPPTFCKGKSCKNFTDLVFTIHGLWPSYSSQAKPPVCKGSQFNEEEIRLLEDELKIYWPSLSIKKTNIEFWGHEWEKHGTCSEQYFQKNQYWYFSTTLTLKKSVDLFTYLKNEQIVPSTKSYSQSAIRDAIKKGTKYKPFLWCRNKDILLEISVCVDSEEKFRDCPPVLEDYPNNQCKKEKIYYPEYDSDEKDEL